LRRAAERKSRPLSRGGLVGGLGARRDCYILPGRPLRAIVARPLEIEIEIEVEIEIEIEIEIDIYIEIEIKIEIRIE